ncbi:MAG: carbohydrate ABC transporter permease [Chloroflexi bacterium]|nr:carbohydrate ABC transporter permease [Chloroflexota bacterium]MCL5109118.1 carbohydrate ABC transporter permease [Chloroflexota bacterium]
MSSASVYVANRRPLSHTIRRSLLYFLTAILLVIVLFPVFHLVELSLKPARDAFVMPPNLIFAPVWDNYALVMTPKFLQPLGNSAVVSVATTVISLILGVPAAYALSRGHFRRDQALSLWTLSTRMAPPVAFGIPFFLIYKQLDWIDTLHGLVIVYLTFNLSLVIWMMRTFFDGIPTALEEAAYIDGASIIGTFWRVTLPLCAPGLATTAIFCFLMSWNDFFFSLILTRSEAVTGPVAIANFMNYETWEWGKISAAGTMIMLPVVLFSLAVRKYLITGLTAGAVKG